MSKIMAYVRTSTDKQDLNNQKLAILEYSRKHKVEIRDFVEVVMSTRKRQAEEAINHLVDSLESGDGVIVTELTRIGRTMGTIVNLVNKMIGKKIRLISLKEGLDFVEHDLRSTMLVGIFSMFAEVERTLISQRTKEALATKKATGVSLGKPKGIIQKSMFDEHRDKIIELLGYGVTIPKIAKFLGVGTSIGLRKYIKTRGL